MGEMGHRPDRRLTTRAAAVLAVVLAAVGRGDAGETSPEQDLRQRLADAVPDGWAVAPPGEAGVDAEGAALVVYRQQAAALRARAGVEPGAARVYFPIHFTEAVEPGRYAAVKAARDDLRRALEQLDRSIGHIPRDASGEPAPRDQFERADVTEYREKKAGLEPYTPLPTHHHRGIGVRVENTRGRLVPEDRGVAQEMNRVRVALRDAIESYE